MSTSKSRVVCAGLLVWAVLGTSCGRSELSNLGSKKYFKRSKLLRKELAKQGNGEKSEIDWLAGEQLFLENHEFHTAFARSIYGEQKETNKLNLKKSILQK